MTPRTTVFVLNEDMIRYCEQNRLRFCALPFILRYRKGETFLKIWNNVTVIYFFTFFLRSYNAPVKCSRRWFLSDSLNILSELPRRTAAMVELSSSPIKTRTLRPASFKILLSCTSSGPRADSIAFALPRKFCRQSWSYFWCPLSHNLHFRFRVRKSKIFRSKLIIAP